MSYRRHLMMADAKEYAVTRRKNPEVMAIVYAQGWAASPKHMTFEEAAAVTDIGNVFNSTIRHFEEFQYFTGVTNINANSLVSLWNYTDLTFPENLRTIKGSIMTSYSKLGTVTFPKYVTYSTGYEYVLQSTGSQVNKVVWNSDTYPVSGFFGNGVLYYDSDNPLYYAQDGHLWSADKTKLYLVKQGSSTSIFQGTETEVYDAFLRHTTPKVTFHSSITKFVRKYVTFNECTITVLDMSACNVGTDYPTFRAGTYRVIKMPTISKITTYGWLLSTNVSHLVFNQSTPPQCTGVAANATGAGLKTNSLVAIYVPDASVDTYKAAPGFSGYAAKIKGLSEYDPTLENV